MYSNKAGVDYIKIAFLDSIVFWAPLIPAVLATIILINPKKFIQTIKANSKKKEWKISLIFSILVFLISYGLGLEDGKISFGIFMLKYIPDYGSGASILDSFKSMNYPFDPSQYNADFLIVWQYITLPILYSVLTAFLIRMIVELIGQKIQGGYPMEFLGRVFLIVGIILLYFYLATPLGAYDLIEQTWLLILPLTAFSLLGIGIGCLLFSKYSKARKTRVDIAGATFIVVLIAIGAMIVTPLVMAIPNFINRENNYETIVWDSKVKIEVEQTRFARALDNFEYVDISNLTTQSTNYDIIDRIRQFDKNSSTEILESKIDTLYETKDDTDIIILNNSEYWVAPKSFNGSIKAFYNAYNRHVVYTHTEGFIAMNAYTGNLVLPEDYENIFGVNASYPIYFGEGYRNDLILNVSDYEEINNKTYKGAPDATLGGAQGLWKVLGLSVDFLPIATRKNSFLRRTNIYNRVGGLLLPFMHMDNDSYLVFDKEGGHMYYSIGLYVELPRFSYYQSNYSRFLGWAVVNVYDGAIDFYLNPSLNSSSDLKFLSLYLNPKLYPWKTAIPSWLEPQIRYPESLYEEQLYTDYSFHVQEWNVWKQKSNLFERPEHGDLYYILMDLGRGDGIEFVGIDLVKPTSGTSTLAGMYVLRLSKEHFGETIFYSVPEDTPLIGPTKAMEIFAGTPGISQDLNILPGMDFGNILLYPFAHSLYYVIPVYSTVGGIQKLHYVGLVNGLNPSEVVWGEGEHASKDAFNILKERYPEFGEYRGDNIEFNSTIANSTVSPDPITFTISFKNRISDYNWSPANLSLYFIAYSGNVTLKNTSGTITGKYFANDPLYPTLGDGMNFSLLNWSLFPSQVKGAAFQINLSLGNFSMLNVPYRLRLVLDDDVINDTSVEQLTFYAPDYAATNISTADVRLNFDLPTTSTQGNNSILKLYLENLNTSFSAPDKHVRVNLTVFYSDPSNVSVNVPGTGSVAGASFSNDDFYPGHAGINFTIMDLNMSSLESYGSDILLNVTIPENTTMNVVYYLTLIVDGTSQVNTKLRVINWSP
ncbi:MAG: UPF0182 family protein [Promethearchaeota archaeon]